MMACPGGCIGGGGQPIYSDDKVLQLRAQALYKQDSMRKYRRSHENPIVQDIYKKYLGEPLSKKQRSCCILATKRRIDFENENKIMDDIYISFYSRINIINNNK
jgi:iron only hydrogenase large subunit-like protein